MRNLKELLEKDYLLGCVKNKDHCQFYLMPVAWWILDYETYDPSILQQDKFNFRNGVYTVHDDKINDY